MTSTDEESIVTEHSHGASGRTSASAESLTSMTDLPADQEEAEEAMAVYLPGIPLSENLKGALGRFLPGALVGVGAVLSFTNGVPGSGEVAEALLMVLAGAAGMTAGFAAGLEGLRRWLYPDAKIAGRKSFIAGLMAPVAVFVVGILFSPAGLPMLLTLLFLVPLVLALLMFFAWLTPTPEALRDEEYVEADELPGMMLRSWPTEGEKGMEGDTRPIASARTTTVPVPGGDP